MVWRDRLQVVWGSTCQQQIKPSSTIHKCVHTDDKPRFNAMLPCHVAASACCCMQRMQTLDEITTFHSTKETCTLLLGFGTPHTLQKKNLFLLHHFAILRCILHTEKKKKTGCENQSLQKEVVVCLSSWKRYRRQIASVNICRVNVKTFFKNSTMKTNASNFTSETIVGLRNKHNQKLGNQTSENGNFSKLEAINQHVHYCAKKGKPHAHPRISVIHSWACSLMSR